MKKVSPLLASTAFFLLYTLPAFAQQPGNPVSINGTTQQNSLGGTDVGKVVPFIVRMLFFIGVLAAVAFLIFGGIKWILSGGDKGKVEAARNHIVAAIIGLVIVVAAFFIINLVFTFLTGTKFDFTNICIPSLTSPTCGQ